jgi:ubiquinone/menaquinone biosynthesis C-methylase UbiE
MENKIKTMSTLHPEAAAGFSQGAARYVRGRPDYPAAIARWLQQHLGLAAEKSVLELGAGTGKFTALLAASGAAVTAVEPIAAMSRQLRAALPTIPVVRARADAIPLPDESQDAVVAAQAFHWFATPEALAEIRRVLRPGGCLGLVWNSRDERVAWVAALTQIMAPHAGDTPHFAGRHWQRVFPAPGFSHLEEQRFPHGHRGPVEQVILDRVLSVSYIAGLPASERAAVAARLNDLIAATPELATGQDVTLPYITFAFSCRKTC